MPFVVSMSLATVPVAGTRTPGGGSVVAERRTMSSDWSGMAGLLDLLDLHQERLELGCLRVAVADHGGQRVGKKSRLGESGESPVDRNADRVESLPVHLERSQALGDHRHRLDVAAVRCHLHVFAGRDSELLR